MRLIGDKPMVTQLTLRLPDKLKEDLQNLADNDRRKLSDYIRIALEEHVESKKEK